MIIRSKLTRAALLSFALVPAFCISVFAQTHTPHPMPAAPNHDAPGYANPHADRTPTVYAWCIQTPTKLERVLSGVDLPYYSAITGNATTLPSPSLWRRYLEWEINHLLTIYPGGVTLKPLTHSVLILAQKLGKQFPYSALGDQSATLVLRHMLSAALHVANNFDTSTYVPRLGPCLPHNCHFRPNEGEDDSFYLDYVSTARHVLSEFFEPAVGTMSDAGDVLDSMAVDRWELLSGAVTVEWLAENLSASIFRRDTVCLQQQLRILGHNLREYLAQHPGERPYEDMVMRHYVRENLRYALDDLNYYVDNRGQCLGPHAPYHRSH